MVIKKKPVAPVVAKAPVRTLTDFLLETSTWASLLTIGATFATGGAAGWLNTATLTSLPSQHRRSILERS